MLIESTLVRHVHDEEADRNVQRPEYMFVVRALRSSAPLHAWRRLLKNIAGVHMIKVCVFVINVSDIRKNGLALFACVAACGVPCRTESVPFNPRRSLLY